MRQYLKYKQKATTTHSQYNLRIEGNISKKKLGGNGYKYKFWLSINNKI